jgi:ribonuclease H-related protein
LAINENVIQVYVDGSYNKDTDLTGAGVVIIYKDAVYKKSFLVKTEEDHSWNIDGECHAALEAIRICVGESEIEGIKIKENNIVINYDYLGIEKWASYEWKAKSKIARLYVREITDLTLKYKLKITFNKVKSHSGDQYNDMVDGLAYQITQKRK